MSDNPDIYLWNVTFASDHFWIGATVPGMSHQMAENVARDQIHQESGMQWKIVKSLRLEDIEYLGIAELDSNK